jgi:oxygen-independent coproporphyrinogen-3 oxidase
MQFSQAIPLSLYVHYPWCIEKCPYCDFNSHTLKNDQEKIYLNALIKQLEQILPSIWGRSIQSIFFGGGTPSLISEEGLHNFLSQARSLLNFQPQIEITLEANPGTVDFNKFKGFREAGVNRLSIGIQSFNDEKLKSLGRIHSADDAYIATEKAKEAGFENFNLDLMFALPNQSLEQSLFDVKTAIKLAPPHLSHYQLTLEPNTAFYKNPPTLPKDDLAWEMQLICQQELSNAGYHQYEVSAYSKTQFQCLHNLNYWQFGDYIGLGAGAHAKITEPPAGKIYRTQMPASPSGYIEVIAKNKFGKIEQVTENEIVFEFMLNALRLTDGFELSLFEWRTGLKITVITKKLDYIQAKNWAYICKQRLVLTQQGKAFLNNVLQVFI